MIEKMGKLLYKLILGKREYNFQLPNPAIKNQRLIITRIWHNENHNDVGIEKLFRLFLASVQFAFPAIYMRHFLWKFGYMYQTIAIETYVILKTVFPLFLLLSGYYTNKWFILLTFYLLIESLCYIMAIIFLSDQLVQARSYRRSVLLLLIDYVLIALDFAVLYGGLQLLGKKAKTVVDYIYFSFVTSATIGYGDMLPSSNFGKLLVCIQSVIFLVFVALVVSLFTSRASSQMKNFDVIKDLKDRRRKNKRITTAQKSGRRNKFKH
jgi:hypothetical protein